MRMKAGVGETFPLVFAEKPAVPEHDVINLVARALAVQPVPLFRRLLALPVTRM